MFPEPTVEDVLSIIEAQGCPMSVEEVCRAWELICVERAIEELISEGMLERDADGYVKTITDDYCPCAWDDCLQAPSYAGHKFCKNHLGGVATKRERIERAVQLRQSGWRFRDIARELEVSPGSVSMWMFETGRWDLWHASPRKLAEWRAAA